jgi:hypothetical protein
LYIIFCLFDQQLKAEVAMAINPRFLMTGEDTSMPREPSMSSEVIIRPFPPFTARNRLLRPSDVFFSY